ncbi:MAG: NAD-dependent epimerase/dehydratase family protein [candidate division NC10 bacterium]|nr:NAD-dependent epimerase/dehydratase family protein [candidate division NC10 bacterium]
MSEGRDHFLGKKVLITGGLGFIGSNLARRLVKEGAQVLLVDSLIPEYGGNLHNIDGICDRVRVNIADVRDEHAMRCLIQGQDYLFNLAGQTSHLDSMRNPFTDLEINCRSQLSILEACRHYNAEVRVIYASTRQMYGVPDYLPVDERHPLHPVDINGINKMAGEWYHLLYNAVYNIRASALRLTNTYGPCMRIKDARQTFLGYWIRQVVMGEEIQVFGDGRQMRDFNYIDDVVEALVLAALTGATHGQSFNLGGDDPISLQDLAASLIDINGGGSYRIVPFPPDRKIIDIGSYYADYKKFHATVGWTPTTPLREGLSRTLAYYRNHAQYYL